MFDFHTAILLFLSLRSHQSKVTIDSQNQLTSVMNIYLHYHDQSTDRDPPIAAKIDSSYINLLARK